MYCYETVFTIPLAIGLCALIFSYKSLSKSKKIYYSILVGSAVLFLLLYVILVFPRIETAYDGSHGSDATLIENAIHIFIAQKTMWVVAMLLAYRIFEGIKNKQTLCFFDFLLLASCAYCCGAATLKLNFVYYYNAAVIVAIPALIYFAIQYIRPIGTAALFLLFAAFYGVKLPHTIKKNQEGRSGYRQHVEQMVNKVLQGTELIWYCPPNNNLDDFDFDGRGWRIGYTQSAIAWSMKQIDYNMTVKEDFSNECGLWFVVDDDTTSFVATVAYDSIMYNNDGMKCYAISNINNQLVDSEE